MKAIKITFLFNQLLTENLYTGGDIRGKIIADFFRKEKGFTTEIVAPEISLAIFKKYKTIIIGHNHLEKKFNHNTLFTAFTLFISRTIELIYQQSIIQTNIIYCTGDFFCNIIPSFIIKILRPKTKFIVCVHHINDNPFRRKSNSFLANTISFLIQRFSFFLIKINSDLIFVVNNQVKKYFINKGYKQPIFITGNGLDTKLIETQINSLADIKATNHISYFGRLSPTKGTLDLPEVLSKVLKTYPNIHLDLVGIALPEIKKPLIQKFTKYKCKGHYTIHDFVENKIDVFKIILKSKIIIFPSYEEGWGISLFESIMTRRPVVAYNLPIFKDLFKDKLATAPIGNINILTKKVLYFLKNYNSTVTDKYINECHSIAKQYDWKNVYDSEKKEIINLFKK